MTIPHRTLEGKWILWTPAGRVERWPIDGKLLLANGEASVDPPDGVPVAPPPAPPAAVTMPAPVAVATPGSGQSGDPLAKKGKGE